MATKKAPAFTKLTKAQKTRVAKKIAGAIRAMNLVSGARYKVVSGLDTLNRERGRTERCGEDGVLDYTKRMELLNMTRNLARNSSTACSILKQFDLQGVGTVGGKATFTFDDFGTADLLRERFAAWTRSADFYDGLSFNTLLKIILKSYLIGGDMVILFDDRLVEDSGRLMVFESDEIGDLSAEDLERAYGKRVHQSQGRIKNANDRTIGVVVSRSERGKTVFDAANCYTLRCDPNGSIFDSKWLMPRNVFRKNQGRGVSAFAPVVATVTDLEDLVTYELQSAKKNSQTLAQVISTEKDNAADAIGSAFAAGTDFSAMTDSEINAAVAEESEAAPITVTLDQIKGAGVLYEAMPDNKRLELLDTKHPNANMPEFIRWLAGRSAAPFGLGSVYATLKADASYTAFRGEQVMSQPAFEEAQKFLEEICDWVIYRWSVWAERRGILDDIDLPENWVRRVSWMWPRMREVNQIDEQNALALKLKNGTGCYRDIYGADWKEKLSAIADEIKFCQQAGLPHPALQTARGDLIDINENKETQK